MHLPDTEVLLTIYIKYMNINLKNFSKENTQMPNKPMKRARHHQSLENAINTIKCHLTHKDNNLKTTTQRADAVSAAQGWSACLFTELWSTATKQPNTHMPGWGEIWKP